LQSAAATQPDESSTAHRQRDALSIDLAKLAAQFKTQRHLIMVYRRR